MKYLSFPLFFFTFILLQFGCSTEEATELDRVQADFLDSLGGEVSGQQWWRTAVTLKINVTTDDTVKLMLTGTQNGRTYLYDYKVLTSTGSITMTAPQGQGDLLYLSYIYKNKLTKEQLTLTGKPEEMLSVNTITKKSVPMVSRAMTPSLSGSSIGGNAEYYQFTDKQLEDFFIMMSTNVEKVDAKNVLGLNCNYELESNGPFYITWVTGNEAEQRSHILGYFYHSPHTYSDIVYVDLSETHKWDYIDGLSKVQYQINRTEKVDGFEFKPNTWYDANFDMHDVFGATSANNKDRVGDNAYNMMAVYQRYGTDISALRGISFKIDVPEGMRIGFYLRADAEHFPSQWSLLKSEGIRPYTPSQNDFMGANFCVEFFNIEGNGKGKHRSFIEDYETVYWMGMEDLIEGGDHDCNDVIFGVVSKLKIWMPDIVDPALTTKPDDPEPEEPEPEEPEPEEPDIEDVDPFPWTIAYEDVGRGADFDFNDAVIKLVPDYESELCCVTVMAAGSTSRMYLHYDGPDGDQTLGEIHELLGSKKSQPCINTQGAIASTPFALVDCVPWPKGYTMGQDAGRFYIEIQRGTCTDCTDVITLAQEPGQMPEAILVAGEWQWPMEGTHIFNTYEYFPKWAQDVTRTRFWEWYKSPALQNVVAY